MSHYFRPFPKINYKIPGVTSTLVVTDITRRFAISDLLKKAGAVYFNYEIKDGDRPDIIADKYYEDQTLDWVVLLTNEIHDPYFEWPLTNYNLNKYVRQKYGSVPNAQAITHHYEMTIQRLTELSDGSVLPKRSVIVDYATYAANIATSRIVDTYTYELELNETRRSIKILDERFIDVIVNEHRRIFE
jgi:hypothetical protein